jgi:nucleoid-associated protein YgaU
MRVRTRSACVVLAWGILLLLVAVGLQGSLRPAQANTRIAGNTSTTTQVTTTNTLTSILASTLTRIPAGTGPASTALTSRSASSPVDRPTTAAAARLVPQRAARPDTGTPMGTGTRTDTGPRAGIGTYVVQPGDTLSGIAAGLGTPGGWPALYAANRRVIGPDPGLIHAGAALALPGRGAPTRYTVAVGDTLSGIAAALATPGGWPTLYAANRQALGPDPNTIRPGTVLAIPRTALPTPTPTTPRPGRPAPAPAQQSAPAKPPASAQPPAPATAPTSARPAPARAPASARSSAPPKATATGGLPRWLQIVLLAAGVLIGIAFVTEPVLALARRRRQPSHPATRPAPGPAALPATKEPRILLADYDRLVVTSSGPEGTVCVLRPPGADPATILVAARLVLAQDRYEELAGHLGLAPPRRPE